MYDTPIETFPSQSEQSLIPCDSFSASSLLTIEHVLRANVLDQSKIDMV